MSVTIKLNLAPPVDIFLTPTTLEFRFLHAAQVESWLRGLADEIHQATRPVEDDSALVDPASKRLRR